MMGLEHPGGRLLPADAVLRLQGRSLAHPDASNQPPARPRWRDTEEGQLAVMSAISIPSRSSSSQSNSSLSSVAGSNSGNGHSENVSFASDVPGKLNELATLSSCSNNEEEQDDVSAVIHKQDQSQQIEALERSLPPDDLSISSGAGVQHFLSQRSEALGSQEQDCNLVSRSESGPGSRASTPSFELEVFLQKEIPASDDQALCDTWLDKESNSASVLASAMEGIPPPMFCNFQNVHQLM